MTRYLAYIFLLAIGLSLTGCESYSIQGRVIHGPISSVQIVDKDEIQLHGGLGIPGAVVDFTLDPKSLGRKPLGRISTRQDGTFKFIPNDVFGAGFLEYQLGVTGQADDFRTAIDNINMPGGDKRLLITLKKGIDTYQPKEDLLKQVKPLLRERN